MKITCHEEKCNQCLMCVRDCVSGVWRTVNGKPEAVEPELCSLCSHCIAVCSRDAISHDGLDAGQALSVNSDQLKPEIYRDIVLSRRSVRNYRNTPVPQDLIEQIIDLSRYAPTASNNENVGYVVVTDQQLIKRVSARIFGVMQDLYGLTQHGVVGRFMNITGLSRTRAMRRMDQIKEEVVAGRDYILHNAPVLILLYAPRFSPFARDNCSIAATMLINYAHSLSLGTCFIGYLTLALLYSPALRKQLSVPWGKRVYASLVMGYPSYGFTRTVSRKNPEIIWRN
jgi:nitroreductase